MSSVIDRFLSAARQHASKPAIIHYGDVWSYERVRGLAEDVRDHAPDARQCVALLFLPQSPAAIAAYMGLMWRGLIPSFMPLPSAKQDPDRYWESHRKLIALIEPALIITTAEDRAPLEAVSGGVTVTTLDDLLVAETENRPGTPASGPDDIALLQHSSGTTGLKKGVQLSHRAIAAQVDAYAAALDATADDVVVSWLPVYHDMGLIACTVTPLMMGQTIVLLDPFRWSAEPASLFDAITDHKGTLCWLPNFAFEHLRRTVRPDAARHDLSTMRAFINCSEPCKAETFDAFAARFADIHVTPERLQVCYAMAETVFAVSQTPLGRPASRIRIDEEALIADRKVVESAQGRELLSCGPVLDGIAACPKAEAGRVGEIHVSGDFLFDGYYKRPEITAQRLRDGVYNTSDMGFVHGGELYVLGRTDDLLIVHGRNYYAHEIEAAVNGVSGLKPGRNVAIAVHNPLAGSDEAVVIAEVDPVVERDAVMLRREIKSAVMDCMGLDLRDALVVPPGWLVKTTSGKISRSENRTKYLKDQRQ